MYDDSSNVEFPNYIYYTNAIFDQFNKINCIEQKQNFEKIARKSANHIVQ